MTGHIGYEDGCFCHDCATRDNQGDGSSRSGERMVSESGYTEARKVEVYKDARGEYRWRRVMRRGMRIVADSGEGYTRHEDAREAAERENPGIEIG